MGYRDWKVYYFENEDDTEGTELTNVTDVRVTRVEDAESNSLELTLSNVNNEAMDGGNFAQQIDGILKVYAAEGNVDVNNSSHLLGTYFIKTHNPSLDGRQIEIVCGDRTYDLLNKVYSNISEESDGFTARDIIFNIVQTSAGTNGDTQNTVPTVMDSTQSDGGSFPVLSYAASNKTAYEAVAELSQPQYTGDDKTYLFWFSEDGTFYWTYPDDSVDSYDLEFTNKDVIQMDPSRNEAETISSIIYNAGKDLEDVTILGLYHDPTSTSTNIKYKTMLDINNLVRYVIQQENGLADRENATLLNVISNDDFKKAVEDQARGRASRYIRRYSRGLWECKIVHKGRRFEMSELHNVTDAISNVSLPNMRIKRIVHKLNKSGWVTNITLEEDEDKVL